MSEPTLEDKKSSDSVTPRDREQRFNGRVSITVTLTVAIGLLVLVSVGSVLGVGLWSSQKNTFDLLSRNANLIITSSINRIRQHLQPAVEQTKFIVKLIEQGKLDPANRREMETLFTGALSAAPQISAIVFIDPQLQEFGVGTDPETGKFSAFEEDLSNDPQVAKNMQRRDPYPSWGPPIWQGPVKTTYLNRIHPIFFNNQFRGLIVSVVAIGELSNFVTEHDALTDGHSFILYGRERVLAHANLVDGYPGRSEINPLPALDTFNDSVLAAIWRVDGRNDLLIEFDSGTEGHEIALDDGDFIFVTRSLIGFGPEPFFVGVYFNRDDVGDEVRRLIISMIAGILALLLSIAAAIFVGRSIAKPIVRFSSAATRVRDLEISEVKNLPGSIFRELNDQSTAFNAMIHALRWFELYVPRKVVASLIRQGDMRETISDDRVITVMFTDMVGFSTISEGMMASQVAALINEHFAVVVSCIEAEGGTIDKFIGDSVMAFWGAPDKQEGHAKKACQAALAIAGALAKDNARRESEGLPKIGIRIGIHTGRATVGNIGSPDRLNYTMIGDTVNIGQRLEQLGKQFVMEGRDATILISAETASEIDEGFKLEPVGRHKLKGRTREQDVFRLS